MTKHILFHVLVVAATVFGLSCGQEENWGDLLRKDGDPEYKDKGIVERASGKTNTTDEVISVKQIRRFLGHIDGLKPFLPEEDEELEEELEGDSGGGSPMDIYRVGNGSRCIVWNYDIFGFNEGRTREIVDLIADNGFTVLIPDYYRGTAAKKAHLEPQTGTLHQEELSLGKAEKRLGRCGVAICNGPWVHDLWRHWHMLGILHGCPDVLAPPDIGRGINVPVTLPHYESNERERERHSCTDSG